MVNRTTEDIVILFQKGHVSKPARTESASRGSKNGELGGGGQHVTRIRDFTMSSDQKRLPLGRNWSPQGDTKVLLWGPLRIPSGGWQAQEKETRLRSGGNRTCCVRAKNSATFVPRDTVSLKGLASGLQ